MRKVDKSVSTEDEDSVAPAPVIIDGCSEIARLEAVLTALVHTKVVAMKAENDKSKLCSNRSSPRRFLSSRLQRMTSDSTSSSHRETTALERRRDATNHSRRHRDVPKGRGKGLRSTSRRRGRSVSPAMRDLSDSETSEPRARDRRHRKRGYSSSKRGFKEDPLCLTDPPLGPSKGHLYATTLPATFTHGCLLAQPPHSQIKINYEDDYVSVNLEDFAGDCEAIMMEDTPPRNKRKRRARRKRHKKRRVVVHALEERVKVIDPDDMSKRARWTIIATAFLLLVMCLLLVGVTLRMAPIIDDMVRQENERLMLEAANRAIGNGSAGLEKQDGQLFTARPTG